MVSLIMSPVVGQKDYLIPLVPPVVALILLASDLAWRLEQDK